MFMIKIIASELWSLARNPESAALENERSNAIVHLNNCNDRLLEDIGLRRDEIDDAVRHGRAANDPHSGRRVA